MNGQREQEVHDGSREVGTQGRTAAEQELELHRRAERKAARAGELSAERTQGDVELARRAEGRARRQSRSAERERAGRRGTRAGARRDGQRWSEQRELVRRRPHTKDKQPAREKIKRAALGKKRCSTVEIERRNICTTGQEMSIAKKNREPRAAGDRSRKDFSMAQRCFATVEKPEETAAGDFLSKRCRQPVRWRSKR
jgi:hypothetical protein